MARAEPHVRSCLVDHPITDEQLEHLKYADFVDGPQPEMQCIVHCFFQRAQFYDSDGRLNAQRTAFGLSFPHQVATSRAVMDVCVHVSGIDDCSTAYQVYKCFKQAIVWQTG